MPINNTDPVLHAMVCQSGITQESFSETADRALEYLMNSINLVLGHLAEVDVDPDATYDALTNMINAAGIAQGMLVCAKVGGFKI